MKKIRFTYASMGLLVTLFSWHSFIHAQRVEAVSGGSFYHDVVDFVLSKDMPADEILRQCEQIKRSGGATHDKVIQLLAGVSCDVFIVNQLMPAAETRAVQLMNTSPELLSDTVVKRLLSAKPALLLTKGERL